MSIKRTVENVTEKSAYLVNDISSVHNLRAQTYMRKVSLVKSPIFCDIVNSVFSDPNHPPTEIYISESSVYVLLDGATNSTVAYQSAEGFDYIASCAIALLFQDLYKNVYTISTATLSQIAEEVKIGRWRISLKMNPQYTNTFLSPAFNVNEIKEIPIEQLPIETTDPQAKKVEALPVVALILGVLSIIFSRTIFNLLFAVFGIILGAIGLKTEAKKKVAITAIILSVIGIVLPMLIGIIGFISLF